MNNFLFPCRFASLAFCCLVFGFAFSSAKCEAFSTTTFPDDSARISFYKSIADQSKELAALLEKGKTREAVELGKELLADLGDMSDLPTSPTASDALDRTNYFEQRAYIADRLFWTLYDDNNSSAIPCGRIAIENARFAHRNGLCSDYASDGDILAIFDAIGYLLSEDGRTDKAIEIFKRGIDYFHETPKRHGDPEFARWYLGVLYSSLAYEYESLPESRPEHAQVAGLWKEAVHNLILSAPSQFDDPTTLEEYLYFALSAYLAPLADQKQEYKQAIDYCISALEPYDHEAVNPVKLVLLSYLADWHLQYGHVRDALATEQKAFALLIANDGIKKLMSIRTQSDYYFVLGDMDNGSKLNKRLSATAAASLDMESWEQKTALGIVAYGKFDASAMKLDRPGMREALEDTMELIAYDPEDLYAVYIYTAVLPLMTYLAEDSKSAAEYLTRFKAAISDAEELQVPGIDIADLKQRYQLAWFQVFGYYWFDELNLDKIFPPLPDDLSDTSSNKLQTMHELAWRMGDMGEAARIEQELLKRGFSREYFELLYSFYGEGGLVA